MASPGFKKVLERVATAWKENHDKIVEQGGQDRRGAARISSCGEPAKVKSTAAILEAAYEQLDRSYDPQKADSATRRNFRGRSR